MTSITTFQIEAQKAVDNLFELTGWGCEFAIDKELGIPKKLIEDFESKYGYESILCIYNYCIRERKVSDEMQAKIKCFLEEQRFSDEDFTIAYDSRSYGFIDGGTSVLINPPTNFFIIPNKLEISNNPCRYKNHDNIFDILGVYKNDDIESEGKIILYRICIEEYAKEYYNNHSNNRNLGLISEEDCSDMLFKIIFWHEMGHWITHWMLDNDEFRWDDRFWELKPNPNDLLEGLAQAITYYFIINDTDFKRLKIMFEYLLLGQPTPYHKHIDIIKHPNFSWKNFFKALEQIRQETTQDLATYLRLLVSL